jgi:hypothetical protein
LQSQYEDELIEQLEFSEDEEFEENGSITLKNVAQYYDTAPKRGKGRGNRVDESKYFDSIAKYARPHLKKG